MTVNKEEIIIDLKLKYRSYIANYDISQLKMFDMIFKTKLNFNTTPI